MQVKEILRVKGSRLLSIDPGGRAVDAVKTMADQNLGSLVVMEQERMVGLLTFHEILLAMPLAAARQQVRCLRSWCAIRSLRRRTWK